MSTTLTITTDTDLTILAEQINAEHRHVLESTNKALGHAYQAGLLLLQAKAAVKHGQWLPWLREHFEASEETAAAYMRVARRWDELANSQRVTNLSYRDALKLLSSAGNIATKFTGKTEWFTPAEHVEAARAVLGEIDLDPASCAFAQQTVKAARYFTEEDDGLEQPWTGRVWLNPPYAVRVIDRFVDKLVDHYRAGDVSEAILLTDNRTDTVWWQTAAKSSPAVCFTAGRVSFHTTEGEPGAPLNGQTFFFFGSDVEPFAEVFAEFGVIAEIRRRFS